MTPDQRKTVLDCVQRIRYMRHGRMGDNIIRAGLIAEGWPIAAINAAFDEVDA